MSGPTYKFGGLNLTGIGAPPGSCIQADNVVMRTAGILEPRKGLQKPAYAGSDTPSQFFSFKGKTMFVGSTGALKQDTGTSLTTISTGVGVPSNILAPDATKQRLRTLETEQGLYLASNAGILFLDSLTGALTTAGVPKAFTSKSIAANTTVPTSGPLNPRWLAPNSSVAYRFVWGRKDANNRLLLGAPSGREIFTAGGSACSVDISVFTPAVVASLGYFLRIYRTVSVPQNVQPSEEYFLVYEYTVTSTDTSNGYTPVITDTTPDTVLSSLAYFSSSQGGVFESNDPPPLAFDLCQFGDRVLYANTQQPHALAITLLGVDYGNGTTPAGTGALQVNDTLTISGRTYTAKYVENAGFQQFAISGSTSPTIAAAETAKSLVRVISQDTPASLIASFEASDIDGFGTITITSKSFSTIPFSATVSARGSSWLPVLPTSGTSVSSDNDAAQNRIYFSKISQPEAVPRATHYINVGSKNYRIHRILECNQKVFVLKEDGIFILSGEAPFRITKLDPTAKVICPDSAVMVGNQIYALTNQGVASITENGVRIIDGAINSVVKTVIANTNNAATGFGVGYETEGQYILFCAPSSFIFTGNTMALVYHFYHDAWTKWTKPLTSAFVNPTTNVLWASSVTSVLCNRPDDSIGSLAYADETFTAASGLISNYTVAANAGTPYSTATVTLTNLAAIVPAVGDWFTVSDGSSFFTGLVTGVSSASTTVVSVIIRDSGARPVVATSIYSVTKAIPVTVLAAVAQDTPGQLKQFSSLKVHLDRFAGYQPSVAFASDLTAAGTVSAATGLVRSVPLTLSGQTLVSDISSPAPSIVSFGKTWSGGYAVQDFVPHSRDILPPKAIQMGTHFYAGFTWQEAYGFMRFLGLTPNTTALGDVNTR